MKNQGRNCNTGACGPTRPFSGAFFGRRREDVPGINRAQTGRDAATPADAIKNMVDEAAANMERQGPEGRRTAFKLRGALATMLAACAGLGMQPGTARAQTTTTQTTTEEGGCEEGSCWPSATETINCLYRQPDISDCTKERIEDEESEGQIDLVMVADPLKPGEFVVDIPTPRMASWLHLDALKVTGDVGAGEVNITGQVTRATLTGVFLAREATGASVLVYGRRSTASGSKLVIVDGHCSCRELFAPQTAYHVVQLRLKITNPQPINNGTIHVYMDARRVWAEDCERPDGTGYGVPLYECGIPLRCEQTVFVPAATIPATECPSLEQLIQQFVIDNPGEPDDAVAAMVAAFGGTGFATNEELLVGLIGGLVELAEGLDVTPADILAMLVDAGYDVPEIIGAAYATLTTLQKIATVVSLADLLGDGDKFSAAMQVYALLDTGAGANTRSAFFISRATAAMVSPAAPGAEYNLLAYGTLSPLGAGGDLVNWLRDFAVAQGGTVAADLKAALP